MILLFIPLSVIVVLVFISYLLNFNIALSILLFIGAIYHLYIIFKDGIRKEDFKKKILRICYL